MDVLTSVVLKMQPGPMLSKRRIIDCHPYVVADDEKIDEALNARGLHGSPSVVERRLLQRMATLLAAVVPAATSAELNSKSRSLSRQMSRLSLNVSSVFQPKIDYMKLFRMLDVNGDGCLCRDEFVSALRGLIADSVVQDQAGDMDGDGDIDDDDLIKIFEMADIDGSGEISANEFCAVLRAAEASGVSSTQTCSGPSKEEYIPTSSGAKGPSHEEVNPTSSGARGPSQDEVILTSNGARRLSQDEANPISNGARRPSQEEVFLETKIQNGSDGLIPQERAFQECSDLIQGSSPEMRDLLQQLRSVILAKERQIEVLNLQIQQAGRETRISSYI
eukprot:gnl/MRDRNA2_/MRDRNA2_77858_c0_seq1.p1 gnl/MRDRNA2_/MRDRNA2_77858_c0~~gnl/MRDRNA2_/MRDRNA2_77858_c0_seq1.p1  ORF type:complete len:380 (+),score=65.06 gnl/MRDRNA2_/MRDRNA2_77858_c0_seq1:141-1142(+)